MSETSPHYRALLGASYKNMNYTLKKYLAVNMDFLVNFQAIAVPLMEKVRTNWLLIFSLTRF